ncbi:hypothetical protein ACWD25_09850 [Streptomyces sp. NPDC002920]
MSVDGRVREVATLMHVCCPQGVPEETYRQVLELLADLSAVVRRCRPLRPSWS